MEGYIDDNIGVHQISATEKTVSLHIYSPPLFKAQCIYKVNKPVMTVPITSIDDLASQVMEGLTTKNDIQFAQNLIERFESEEIMQKVAFRPDVYNRIKLFRNDHIEILLLCWEKNQGSPIHNHP